MVEGSVGIPSPLVAYMGVLYEYGGDFLKGGHGVLRWGPPIIMGWRNVGIVAPKLKTGGSTWLEIYVEPFNLDVLPPTANKPDLESYTLIEGALVLVLGFPSPTLMAPLGIVVLTSKLPLHTLSLLFAYIIGPSPYKWVQFMAPQS